MTALVCTPAYGGQLTVGYFRSAFGIKNDPRSVGVDFLVTEGESHVTRARNNLVSTFLNHTDHETLVFLDADIEIQPDDFFRLLELKGVRGAAVACKTPDRSEFLSIWAEGKRLKRAEMPSEPFSCEFLGTAVLAVDREIFERLRESEAVAEYQSEMGPAWDFFRDGVAGDVWESEDYGFCRLCAAHDIPITCDPSIVVAHYGVSAWTF